MMKYVKIRLLGGGGAYVVPLEKVGDAIVSEIESLEYPEAATFKFTPLEITQEEFEVLPEFQGH